MTDSVRLLTQAEHGEALEIINAAAVAYRGVIPADCWHEPYMSEAELAEEVAAGVRMWGVSEPGRLLGVMGIQPVKDVYLIRHAYVRPELQRRGIGVQLLDHLRHLVDAPILIGTWADATWAIRFYEKHGFALVDEAEAKRLLEKYWNVPERQARTSVVLRRGG
jgi:GNAT superfamily N-acetyltransferase